MEQHISQIELINHYINGQLSETEKLNFENQLQSNPELNALYEEHLIFLEGIKRTQLKAEIASAKSSYITIKWVKIIGIPVLIISLIVLGYSLFFNQSNSENLPELLQEQEIVTKIDSLKTNINLNEKNIDSSKYKFVVLKKIETQIEDKNLTKHYGGVVIVRDTVLIENLGYFTKFEFDKKFPNLTQLKPINDTLIIIKRKPVKIYSEDKVTTVKEEYYTSNETEIEISDSVNKEVIAFYQSVKKVPQNITINTEKPFSITCKEGTKLTIPAKAFIDSKTGKLARGTINLEVTEYYKLSDMLLANLTTKSDNNQLETGGMLYIKANKNGSQLNLKSDKRIRIQFPDKGKKDMQLFSGIKTKEGINWVLENEVDTTTEEVEVAAILESEPDVQVPINLVEEPPIFPGCENKTREEKVTCFSDAINKVIKKNFNANNFVEELNLNGKYRISVSFVVNEEGKIDEIVAGASHTKLAKEAVRVVELLPQMIPAKQRGLNVKVPYAFPILFQIGESTKINQPQISFKAETQFEKQIKARLASKDSVAISEITEKEYARYAFTTSKLGWINCDRFVRTKNRTRFKLKIKDAKGADVKLVFKSISSILPSKKRGVYTDFGDVPANEEVVLIAIKKVEGKLFLGIKNTTTKPIDELDLDFKEVSVDQLKAELQALNNEFN